VENALFNLVNSNKENIGKKHQWFYLCFSEPEGEIALLFDGKKIN
jgi:hypothetical protein